MFKVETRLTSNHAWTDDCLGDQNEFDSRDAASAAIAALRLMGGKWASARYRVVPIDTGTRPDLDDVRRATPNA